jgi:hypothetical protein
MLLEVFFGRIRGEPFVTSSPALARRISKLPLSRRELKWPEPSINWFPLPGSRVEGLRTLFADQLLIFHFYK